MFAVEYDFTQLGSHMCSSLSSNSNAVRLLPQRLLDTRLRQAQEHDTDSNATDAGQCDAVQRLLV